MLIIAVASGTLNDVPEKEEALSGLPILLLLWGLVGAAGEYRHRTAAPAARRRRSSYDCLFVPAEPPPAVRAG